MSKLRFVAALCAVAGMSPSAASAVCRVVTPVAESGRDPVVFDPTTMAVFVVAPDQIVDYECPTEPIPLVPMDPRPSPFDPADGNADDAVDAGIPMDAGFDPSTCDDGSMATPVIGSLVHVIVQPSIYADGGEAGLIMPVPARADVHVGPEDVMRTVASLQRARVEETVTFTEDPTLGHQCSDPHYSALDDVLAAPLALYGCGDMDSAYYRPGLDRYETESEHNEGGVVEVERIPATDDYEVAMINASSLEALTTWLDDNGFAHSHVDDAAFSAYVQEGAWFMAVKVTPEARGGQHVALAPLVVTWIGETVPVMNRLQYQPGGGMLITDAFVIAETRMGVADGDGDIEYAAPADFGSHYMLGGFGIDRGWLTRIVLTRNTNVEKEDTVLVPSDATWEIRPVITREVAVRIAGPCCPGNAIPDSAGATRTFTEERTYLEGEGPADDYFRMSPPVDPEFCPGGAMYEPSDDSGYYGDDGGGYYYCSVEEARSRRRMVALASWFPLLMAFGGILWRRRRLRHRARGRS